MANPMMIILCFFIVLLFPTSTFANNKTDLQSLLAFKAAIDVDPQGALSSWNQTLHFCQWNGVRCGTRHPNRVVEINLTSQGLLGSFSPHIGNLSFLRIIDLSENRFHSPIPHEISGLSRLKRLDLSNNTFTGPIPQNMSNWPHLIALNLNLNNLEGHAPAELGNFMPRLKVLYLSQNVKLSGRIPASIGNLSSLLWLNWGRCSLTGDIPESLAHLTKLEFILLGENELTGKIPSGLFNMSALSYFFVAMNNLSGTIPSTMGLTLPKMRRFYLYDNQFTGNIPTSISNASLLERFQINNNYFTGPIPRADRLSRLESINLSENLIEDDVTTFIPSLINSTNLTDLQVFENLLTGYLPESIANLSTRLQMLLLGQNKIHGKIPTSIGNLVSLDVLGLYQNNLEGPIPMAIGKLSNLHLLYLQENRLTDTIPSSLGNLTSLIDLLLSENKLSGNVPSSLVNCTSLNVLHLGHNNFGGFIPREIMSLSSISIVLNLSYNAFEGQIPNEIGSLTNLGILDLSYNRLFGLIPNSISKCGNLLALKLQANSLQGEIPTGLSALRGLQDLDLSANSLVGPIPHFLGTLNLSKLNLSLNRLHGEVPIEGVFKNIALISLDGNEQLCGGISDLKFTPCSSPKKSHKKNFSTLLKIVLPVFVVGGICLVILAIFTYKKRVLRKSVSPTSLIGTQFMRLSYADLSKATGGFAETNLLGAGRFGSVYKGILDGDGQKEVAVKVLNLYVRGASKSFMAECDALRDVRHRNLLSILTVCESIDFQGNDFKALVYEFKANGSLEKWLYHNTEPEANQNAQINVLSMMQRLNVAVDIAQAIEYLHFGTESSIVHGDLKPSNILLDHEMTSCVGDFGLAKIVTGIVPSQESYSSIGIRGTIGYVPPEYGTCDSVSTQGDVYSYGILLLEIFTNIRPTDNMFKDDLNLHNFVSATLLDRVTEIVDEQIRAGSEMKNDKMKECMGSILSIGVSCSKEIPRDRMSMEDVVNQLCKIRTWLCSV